MGCVLLCQAVALVNTVKAFRVPEENNILLYTAIGLITITSSSIAGH